MSGRFGQDIRKRFYPRRWLFSGTGTKPDRAEEVLGQGSQALLGLLGLLCAGLSSQLCVWFFYWYGSFCGSFTAALTPSPEESRAQDKLCGERSPVLMSAIPWMSCHRALPPWPCPLPFQLSNLRAPPGEEPRHHSACPEG